MATHLSKVATRVHTFTIRKALIYFAAFFMLYAFWDASWHGSVFNTHGKWLTAWEWLFDSIVCAALMVIALILAERIPPRIPRWLLMILIALVVALATAWIHYWVLTKWWGATTWWDVYFRASNPAALQPWLAMNSVLLKTSGFAAIYYFREYAFQSTLRLREAETDRARASQRLIESRLLAMQAQVEPAFLLSALRRVESLYDAEPERAERALDQLITYLRAAMPMMRSSTSTLERESVLVGSYLDVLSALLDEKIAFSFSINPEHRNLKFPPMICLPLAAELASARVHASSIHFMASLSAEAVSVSAVYPSQSGALAIDNSALVQIRERLAALFGGQAQLTLALRGDQLSEIKISVPNTASADDVTNPLFHDGAALAERRAQPRAMANPLAH